MRLAHFTLKLGRPFVVKKIMWSTIIHVFSPIGYPFGQWAWATRIDDDTLPNGYPVKHVLVRFLGLQIQLVIAMGDIK